MEVMVQKQLRIVLDLWVMEVTHVRHAGIRKCIKYLLVSICRLDLRLM